MGRIFRELAFIREINSPPCDPYVYVFVRPVHKMALYKYFKNAPSTRFSLGSYTVRSHFSAKREVSGLVHQDTGQNSKTINSTRGRYASFPQRKPLFLNRKNSVATVPCVGRGGYAQLCRRECFATCPRPYLFIQFSRKYFSRNRIFPLIREIYNARNIRVLRYVVEVLHYNLLKVSI